MFLGEGGGFGVEFISELISRYSNNPSSESLVSEFILPLLNIFIGGVRGWDEVATRIDLYNGSGALMSINGVMDSSLILISSIICAPISFLNFFSRSHDSRNGMTCRTSLDGVDGVSGFLTVAPGRHGCRRDTKSGVGRDGLSQTVPDVLKAFLK